MALAEVRSPTNRQTGDREPVYDDFTTAITFAHVLHEILVGTPTKGLMEGVTLPNVWLSTNRQTGELGLPQVPKMLGVLELSDSSNTTSMISIQCVITP